MTRIAEQILTGAAAAGCIAYVILVLGACFKLAVGG